MISVTIVGARKNFSDLINKVFYNQERIIINRRDKPMAALISIEDLELLEQIENKNIREAFK